MATRMKNTTKTIIRPIQHEANYKAVLEGIEEGLDAKYLELLEAFVEEYEACQPEDREDEDSEDLDDYELMSRVPEAETLSLVNLELANGNEVRFPGVPTLAERMMSEIADAGVEDFLINPGMRPVEIFQRLAPSLFSW